MQSARSQKQSQRLGIVTGIRILVVTKMVQMAPNGAFGDPEALRTRCGSPGFHPLLVCLFQAGVMYVVITPTSYLKRPELMCLVCGVRSQSMPSM